MSNYNKELTNIKKSGYYRDRLIIQSPQDSIIEIKKKKYINFSSNNYLNLSNNKNIKQAIISRIQKLGVGSGSSPLISGYNEEHHKLEKDLSKLLNFESSLIMNSGYLANVGLANAVSEKNIVIFQDKLNHNSIIEGTRLSTSKLIRYKHNSYDDLEKKLLNFKKYKKIIYTDSVFSMTGEIANIPILSNIAKKHSALLFVDDAHGFGVLRKHNNMFPSCLNFFHGENLKIDAYIGTFGKAAGTFGSFIAGSKSLINFLIQKSKPYIYSTALPAVLVSATRESINMIMKEKILHHTLKENISFFKKYAVKNKININESITPIQTITYGCPKKVTDIQNKAFENGLFIQAIRYPTVPKNKDLLRINLTSGHSLKQIEKLLNFLRHI